MVFILANNRKNDYINESDCSSVNSASADIVDDVSSVVLEKLSRVYDTYRTLSDVCLKNIVKFENIEAFEKAYFLKGRIGPTYLVDLSGNNVNQKVAASSQQVVSENICEVDVLKSRHVLLEEIEKYRDYAVSNTEKSDVVEGMKAHLYVTKIIGDLYDKYKYKERFPVGCSLLTFVDTIVSNVDSKLGVYQNRDG